MGLTTKEAIELRRSIRKYKDKDLSDEIIHELIDSARLAPSGCNSQPWRFKIVRDPEIKKRLAVAAHNQKFVSEAPVVLVCCLDVKGYLDGTVSGLQDLEEQQVIDERIYTLLIKNAADSRKLSVENIISRTSFNVAIAIEHIVLRALDFGLGTCWVRLVDGLQVRKIFDWDENISVVALLPVGYPDEDPKPRKRLGLEDILL
jgi:nitroreductase